jgi:hypothetical protein
MTEQSVIEEIASERLRQMLVEGWTPAHDDEHAEGEIARAAACYATQGRYHYPIPGNPPPTWPWAAEWWKPKGYRRNLIRAAALLVAEIERLDRKEGRS